MKTITKEYQITGPNYTHYYEIEFRWLAAAGHYEIWVPYHPDDPFGNDDQVHHLVSTGKLCVREGKEPRNFEAAEAICYYWMERFSRYTITQKFTDDGASVDVPD